MNGRYSHIVLGLGATGKSVVRYLMSQGILPLVMDSRRNPPGGDEIKAEYPQLECHFGGFDCRSLVQAKQIIISPGIPLDTPEVRVALDMGIEVIGDVELFARAIADRPPCVLAITGSNGKSTVTTLVGEMLKQAGLQVAVGGNIGVPALDLLQHPATHYVLELSSFQLETTNSLDCLAATCLNISEDHMDRYSDLEAYRHAKLRLFEQSRLAIYNRDDELTKPLNPMNNNSFGLDNPDGDEWGITDGKIVHGSSEIMNVMDVALLGTHNQANMLAAMALADAAGVDKASMAKVAEEFKGLPHRCELVAVKEGVTWVNDSKATNVGATLAALQGFSDYLGDIILIAGGDGKGADFSTMQAALKGVSKLITLGRDGDKIAAQKEGAIKVKTMAEAVAKAHELANSGDIVLLSPACASLDMYSNFMARGDDFRHLVEALDEQQD
ncbi:MULTISPECIES: UDP-N-acetylmuramoyl-L-alanine--D-glutamate ligase [Shewanella]|jgi:UDP-N-acetylmuramoylalanine--D-glutamate ligase|uniref:UDP-N-acetylmuramoyl-L-alanine--D-glutamate ligase n=1 Tax=Shewanella TaxID=22 RepID=UPI0016730216|nr:MULTISPECIES: UDP-N-acetylmuramoyl-L-alanine--D-glutamate ligase [Shewanella]MBO1271995.1 UDP-N-acetylmuramoyl-L-alanine--D-glutamate ligase [Shewanella sp. 4t3-1-2LB]MCL2907221.1 UDP-N-acetylmuramoyl-L-alanine--D-glutamate ligase [Shewanella fodinae]GGZ07807.1 UDP-N-acetylmuramoylalanine--D-glutamate ligase [Shewanella fodinae]